MKTYRLENLHTGEELIVTAKDSKIAHEIGQATWPGVPIEVCTVDEYDCRQAYIPAHNQILDALDGVFAAIPDGRYDDILRCLAIVKGHVTTMEHYFRNRHHQTLWFDTSDVTSR